ncbi:hypothetical protein [Gordonia sp. NPDC058843]|uniref:hypothetical protein n=1 Tax=Gordonia sp. NPDC058843 TaxID=3346648 RepID=UPI00367DBAC1
MFARRLASGLMIAGLIAVGGSVTAGTAAAGAADDGAALAVPNKLEQQLSKKLPPHYGQANPGSSGDVADGAQAPSHGG